MRIELFASNWTTAANRLLMQVLVTLIVLVAALFVILSKNYDRNSQHWAYGTIGTLVGFWLRAGR